MTAEANRPLLKGRGHSLFLLGVSVRAGLKRIG